MLNKEKPVTVEIDNEKCTHCGLCTSICAGEYLVLANNSIKINENSLFGCVQCGNCMMMCPNNAIKVRGEGVSENDIIPLNDNLPDFDAVNSLFLKRRSIRKFKNQEIPQEIINKILEAASTAPISIPPSETKILVINGFDKVQELADELVIRFDKVKKVMNPVVLSLFRPFMGENKHKVFKEFVLPLLKTLSTERKKGNDILFYNAPAVLLFYGTSMNLDKEDQIIASTYASIAAEAMGLGTCIIGSVVPGFDDKLKKKYGILKDEPLGTAFILGYPDQKFNKGIKRKFNAVRYH
jgi:nitroreductase/NAD-dependent dihydropyrimidine dehydrogenase PreA subunit